MENRKKIYGFKNCVNADYLNQFQNSIPSFYTSSYSHCLNVDKVQELIGNKPLNKISFEDIKTICDIPNLGTKFALLLLMALVEDKHYAGAHSDKYKKLLPEIKRILEVPNSSIRRLITDDIDYMEIFPSRKTRKCGIATIRRFVIGNELIRNVFVKATHLTEKYDIPVQIQIDALIECLPKTLLNIKRYEDISSDMIWEFLFKVRQEYPNQLQFATKIIRAMFACSDCEMKFERENGLSRQLVMSGSFYKNYSDKYYFVDYDIKNIPYGHSKICMVFRNADRESTAVTYGSWALLDVSKINDVRYRDFVLKFMYHQSLSFLAKGSGAAIMAVEGLEFLEKIKNKENYPNPNLFYISNEEAFALRNYFLKQDVCLSTMNNKIGWIRRMLEFGIKEKAFKCDNMVMDYLRQFEEPAKTHGNPIPPNELNLLISHLKKKSVESIYDLEIYTICRLCLETEFRVSNICHLKVDCIKPSFKPGRYRIITTSKTSHREQKSYEITKSTYKLLTNVIEKTDKIRQGLPTAIAQYLFIGSPRDGMAIRIIDSSIVYKGMRKACEELSLPVYSAKNLRDTHMTQALSFAIEKGKTNLELGMLTKHKNIDTTLNHYVGPQLEKMLEATYQIIIGDTSYLTTENSVLDSIPTSVENEAHSVENNCGFCTKETCTKLETNVINSLPCFCCKDFVTSPKYEAYFKRRIEEIDAKLLVAVNPHDIEDLTTIKRICVRYLQMIYLHKELKNKGDTNVTN